MKVDFAVNKPVDQALEERGRKLFAGQVDFLKGVVAMDGLPPADRPEICFAGRSNVGKSSLINALTGRKALARTSNTPGRTQEINYFDLGGGVGWLVDVPGYGYAEAPVKVVEKWQRLLRGYLSGRPTLRRAFVLIDSRHGIKKVDHEIMDLLDRAAVGFQAVLTKRDKVKGAAFDATLEQVKSELSRHVTAYPEILVTSSETGEGLNLVRAAAASLFDG